MLEGTSSHNLVVPPLLRSSGAVDGNVGVPREGLGYVSVHMTTVHVNPTKEVLGDLLGPVQSRSRVYDGPQRTKMMARPWHRPKRQWGAQPVSPHSLRSRPLPHWFLDRQSVHNRQTFFSRI